VRATKGDSIFFRIPREKLRPQGLKRLERLERYNNYKVALLAEAKRKNFTIPPSGLSVTFFLPCPKSWSKKKRKAHHGLLCQSKPDADNLLKSFFDSLISEDKYIANISVTKRWVDNDTGWIECSLHEEPMQVLVFPPAKE
jgi:Holliday junction resolvase RusA-like endonuclease